ncbi:MAG TPA: MraY family glycosyltransferase [Candidatus Angelobacter sp.]|jgi:UDP-GlcNAc:undecaprenyl-phosphate GlcNAc-1-phosphate transferase
MLIYVTLLIVSAAIAAGLTKIVRDTANKSGLAFAPDSSRHVHTTPIPRLGGVAVFFTFLVISLLYWVGVRFGYIHQAHSFALLYVCIPASALFVVGLIDDLCGLNARVKLAAQVLGGTFLYFRGFRLACVHSLFDNHILGATVCFALTVGCVVLICNAINLIDGLDGLAAGAALFSMVTIFTFASVNGRHGSALAVTILAGANLGFLFFNFNPASIFLGDSGSLFIGFMLSGLVMSESGLQTDSLHSVLVPIISLALPLTDLTLAIIRRYLSGHSLFGADREHIHHKLLALGLSQRQVVCVLYAVSALCTVLSLMFLYPSRLVAVPVVGILALFFFFGIRRLKYQEFSELERFALRVRQQKQVAASNIALLKAVEQLKGTHKANKIIVILELCLRRDFDGFRIHLDPGHWLTIDFDDQPTREIERFWSVNDRHDHLVLSMNLITPRFGKIGRISLEHSADERLMGDSSLLQGEFRRSLCLALEQCIITMPEELAGYNEKAMAHKA